MASSQPERASHHRAVYFAAGPPDFRYWPIMYSRCPTQTASILSQSCKFRFQSCKFRFLKSNSTFTTTYGRQPLAVACSCSVGRLAVVRRGGGVHHGDGDGQAVVQEKEQHLQPSLRGRSTRKSRRASWPPAALYSALRLVREWCRGVERVERVECVERVERSGTVDTVDTR